MTFSDILGQEHLKKHLKQSVDHKRIAHAQLFIGDTGYGSLALAIAYANYILLSNTAEKDKEACRLKLEHFTHPDLHFVFPVTSTETVKKNVISSRFLEHWRAFLKQTPYTSLQQWHKKIGVEKKQSIISAEQAIDMVKTLSLKAYEGGYKIMIVWMAEKMNNSAANKLLKLIEEPPKDTIFLLLCEQEEQLLSTIRSRCQSVYLHKLAEPILEKGLITQQNCTTDIAHKIAQQAQGSFYNALRLFDQNTEDHNFESWFVQWVRTAFKAKGNKAAVVALLQWSDTIAKTGREIQKQFLLYCLTVFRQALLKNYKTDALVFMKFSNGFSLEKFAPFVHGGNIIQICDEIETALYHIHRNANAKIVFSDLSIKLTRLLHQK